MPLVLLSIAFLDFSRTLQENALEILLKQYILTDKAQRKQFETDKK